MTSTLIVTSPPAVAISSRSTQSASVRNVVYDSPNPNGHSGVTDPST